MVCVVRCVYWSVVWCYFLWFCSGGGGSGINGFGSLWKFWNGSEFKM